MKISVHPEANEETQRAGRHYTEIHPELGKNFRAEVEEALTRISEAPTAWHPLKKDFRRCSLNRFPFGIIYRLREEENECQIFAVMHFKRKPGYWEHRRF
jgi:hypothetical protein